MRTAAILSLLLLTGCTTGGGAKWYAPATWFSHAPAASVDTATAKVERAEDAVVKGAQKSAHETQVALMTVPDSRSTGVARRSNDTTVALLDQVAGPLSAADIAGIREMVAGLTSENAELRAKAEREYQRSQADINEASKKLTDANAKLGNAQDKLRVAFERENELANQLRSQRALFWIAVGVGSLGFIGWMYVRLTLGGLPTALGRSLNNLRSTAPAVADQLVNTLDVELSPAEQTLIRLMAAKHK
jgi:hypothetical protein